MNKSSDNQRKSTLMFNAPTLMEAHSPYNNTWNCIYNYNYNYIYIFFIILILWSDSVAQILYFEKQCRKNTNMDIWSKFTIG